MGKRRRNSEWWRRCNVLLLALLLTAQQQVLSATDPTEKGEPNLNSQMFPKRILPTGAKCDDSPLTANAVQLSDNIGLTPVLQQIKDLRSQVEAFSGPATLESLAAKQDLYDTIQHASLIVQRTNLDVDFTLSEIESEESVYHEWLAACLIRRDRVLGGTILASGSSNLALWSTCEALAIPTGNFAATAGIIGVLAGVIPSVASMYALKAASGSRYTSENDPNMLAGVFGSTGNEETRFPKSVWTFLYQVPANETTKRTRQEQLIDRWITDTSIPTFTNRESVRQRDILTASGAHAKALSIDTLNMRLVMLQQLAAEIQKMKRMLLELTMAVDGSKPIGDESKSVGGRRISEQIEVRDSAFNAPAN
jgi:hypothetical protein